MDISNKKLIEEVEEAINEIESLLPNDFDGKTLSKKSKLPYKLASIYYSYSYRFHAIANSALQLFKFENYLSSAILIRSLMETASVLFLVEERIERNLNSFNCEETDKFLMKILVGGKLKSYEYFAYNCLKAIDKVDGKKYDQFREMYDQLSEFAHPNWAGSAGYFSKIESEGIKIFTLNDGIKNPFFILFPFSISITVLIDSINSIKKLMPKFIKICESSCQRSAQR
ncbi:MAG: hypothetical protein WEA58_12335 [Balneolaceae bacterium]